MQTQFREININTKILLLSAVDAELDCIDEMAESMIKRNIHRHSIGIGLLETAANLSVLLNDLSPDWIIFSGSCGAVASNQIGALIIPDFTLLYDDGIANGHAYFPNIMPHKFTLQTPFSSFLANKINAIPFPIHRGGIASPPAISNHKNRATNFTKMQIIGENLELASVAFCAQQKKIPCAAILGVSNHINTGAHAEWLNYRTNAEKSACFFLKEFFNLEKFS